MNEAWMPRKRLGVIFGGGVFFALILLAQAARVQLSHDDRLAQLARRQFESRVLIQPRRGLILDRNGEALAINREVHSLAADPSKIHNRRAVARWLAALTGTASARWVERLGEKREFIWIKRHLSEAEVDRITPRLVQGLWLVRENERFYPHGELACHTLGSVDLDTEGTEGVELWTNTRLRGTVASVSAVRDALGRATFLDAEAAKGLKDGDNVTLTLDASLQYEVEQSLRASVQKHGAAGGSVIVMNAVTGEILALANEPAFNPNRRSGAVASRRNRAFTDGYEPGSTLKAVLLSSALSHGAHLTDTIWAEHGQTYVQGKRISEAEVKDKFGWLTLKEMVQHSSNVAAAKLALKTGSDTYRETLVSFGFGAKTGSGFPGEISGRVPPRKAWTPLTLANVGFGQGVLVTPLQMIRAYAAIANGGWLVQPTLVRAPEEWTQREPPRRVVSARVASEVVEALQSVTEGKGTGLKAVLDGYRIAGKTGTAQLVDPQTGRYSRSRHVASFIGFATGVEPRIVVFTSLQEPKGIYFAAETAAPLFRDVFAAVANRFSLPPQERLQQARLASSGDAVGSDLVVRSQAQAEHSELGTMPNLLGLTPREALLKMAGQNLKVEIRGQGLVLLQTPAPGAALTDGGLIQLHLAEP